MSETEVTTDKAVAPETALGVVLPETLEPEEAAEFEDGESVTDADEEDGDSLGAPTLSAALEALLLVAEEPMTVATLARAASSSSLGVTSPFATMPASAVASCARKSIMPKSPDVRLL